MKVSIIVPVYNVSPYIERCLLSIVSQTFTDIECIIVDDCGNDNSIGLAQTFIHQYNGNIAFTILRHDKNKGQAAARNTALKKATGNYVYFLDSDDAITPDCIDTLMSLAKKHPDTDFVQGNYLDKEGCLSQYGWKVQLPEYCCDHERLENYFLSTVVTSACNKVIKKSFLTDNNLYFPEGIIHEDMYWSFFLTTHTKAVAFANQGTYIYYINDNSTMTAVSKTARIKRYTSRIYASQAFCAETDRRGYVSKRQRHFIAGNLTCAMIELSKIHSIHHWCIFWQHIIQLYCNHSKLTFWQHILFLFMMPPLCFPIGIKGWYWRVQRYIVNRI